MGDVRLHARYRSPVGGARGSQSVEGAEAQALADRQLDHPHLRLGLLLPLPLLPLGGPQLRLVRGDPVAPPELPRDAPVFRFGEPVVPGLLEGRRDELEVPALLEAQRGPGHGRAVDEPLRLHARLDDVPAPRADHHPLRHALGSPVGPGSLERPDHLPPGLEAVHRLELRAAVPIEGAVVVHDVQEPQLMPLATREVVRVVGRGHLDRPGSFLHVHELSV
mmetsp:Transcript_15420/g.37919  ORF Transcript_15420/g.37919 Transcript_15420/m.37919 type:complete len:221 (-) Transcript_15420:4063-4725(-)